MESPKRILIIAGPNGAGKTTLGERVSLERGGLSQLHQRRSHSGRPESVPPGRSCDTGGQADAQHDYRLRRQRRQLRVRDHSERERLRATDPPLAGTGISCHPVLPATANTGGRHRPRQRPCSPRVATMCRTMLSAAASAPDCATSIASTGISSTSGPCTIAQGALQSYWKEERTMTSEKTET